MTHSSRVLVTGATGFVGHHLVQRLTCRDDMDVICMVRPGSDRGRLSGLPVSFVEADLERPETLPGICAGVQQVFHTACAVQDTFAQSAASQSRFWSVNVEGTLHLAREALRCGVQRFVHLSSTAAMGNPVGSFIDESQPCHPTTPYGKSKRAAELDLLKLHDRDDLPVVILRPCLVVGPGKQNSELQKLFRLVRWGVFPLIGRGDAAGKPMLHVKDLVAAMELAASRGRTGSIYLVTSGITYPLDQIVSTAASILGVQRSHLTIPPLVAQAGALLAEVTGRLLRINPPLTRARLQLLISHREIRIDRIQQELGYTARVTDLAQMLGEVYQELKQRGRP